MPLVSVSEFLELLTRSYIVFVARKLKIPGCSLVHSFNKLSNCCNHCCAGRNACPCVWLPGPLHRLAGAAATWHGRHSALPAPWACVGGNWAMTQTQSSFLRSCGSWAGALGFGFCHIYSPGQSAFLSLRLVPPSGLISVAGGKRRFQRNRISLPSWWTLPSIRPSDLGWWPGDPCLRSREAPAL